jgi:hypothetical protein
MVCRVEAVASTQYDYCPDSLPPQADRMRAIMFGQFVDELSGLGLVAELSVSSGVQGLNPRTSNDGIAGLIGNPARRFPGLSANAASINMRVAARRYVERRFNFNLGPYNTGLGYPADFPAYFQPIDLGTVAMHRQATSLRGRTVQANGTPRLPLAGVRVRLTGMWSRFPAADVDPLNVIESPDILSLSPGLYRERVSGVNVVRDFPLILFPGEEKTLLLAAAAGDYRLSLSDRINLTAGSILAIDITHPESSEYIEIIDIQGASTDAQPAEVTLAYPVRRAHRQSIPVVRVLPQVPGANNTMTRDAIPGDQTVFLDNLTDISATGIIQISGGLGAPEYQTASLYDVVSDIDGYFVLPPLAQVAEVRLQGSRPDLSQPVNQIIR